MAKITGSQDRSFGSENKRVNWDPDAWIPGMGQTVGMKGLGEPTSLGSGTAASQNYRICIRPPLPLLSQAGEGRRGRRRDQTMG